MRQTLSKSNGTTTAQAVLVYILGNYKISSCAGGTSSLSNLQ
jgi:hypothetical protein